MKTTYSYDPFGNVTISGEASDNPFQYTGRENDGTGLHYYRARYYSSELQRFISEDPIGLAGGDINFYSYVYNDPADRIDPEGLQKGPPPGGYRRPQPEPLPRYVPLPPPNPMPPDPINPEKRAPGAGNPGSGEPCQWMWKEFCDDPPYFTKPGGKCPPCEHSHWERVYVCPDEPMKRPYDPSKPGGKPRLW